MVKEFVEGWDVIQVLGEGAYGEVVLIINRKTQEAVAAKAIETSMSAEAAEISRKEILIHRKLTHKHIIKFYGHRDEKTMKYIFLQYASGGELFDRIEPDYGMPTVQAQKYFSQIISGVEYLHSVGVAHRDLKPENVLLDENDDVKISDFGLATIFRHNGRERLLNKRCGTLPYVAPEVFQREYNAVPADIWSCGIILVAMLAGELPWDHPVKECKEYSFWKDRKFTLAPWTKIDNLALALLQKVLNHSPKKRYNISQIKNHLWLTKSHQFKGIARWEGENIDYKRLCSDVDRAIPFLDNEFAIMKMGCSQPEAVIRQKGEVALDLDSECLDVLSHGISFSQPAHPEDMILSSQISSSSDNSQTITEKLVVRRMTRFFVKADPETAVRELKLVLDKLGYSWKKSGPGQVVVTTVDRRKTSLIFKATLVEMKTNILLDFRLSRGDGLDFKRHFLAIQRGMANFVVKGPQLWPFVADRMTSKS